LAELAVELNGHVHTGELLAGSAPTIEALLAAGGQMVITTALGRLDVVQGLEGGSDYGSLRGHAIEVEPAGGSPDGTAAGARGQTAVPAGQRAGAPGRQSVR